MKTFITFTLIISFLSNLPGQGIRGGEVFLGVIGAGSVNLMGFVNIFRENEGRPEGLIFDWGDGNIDTLSGHTTNTIRPGIVADVFLINYHYEQPGIYTIRVRDSFLIDDIANIPNSGQQVFELVDTFGYYQNFHEATPPFSVSQADYYQTETGAIVHDPGIGLLYNDSMEVYLTTFPAEGATLPAATDSISCCDPFIWDRPTQTGKFAFAIRARGFRNGLLAGTATRAIVFDVDSLVTTSVFELPVFEQLSIFPNPASDVITIQLDESISDPQQLTITDISGKPVLQKTLPLNQAKEEIVVRDWLPGVYAVHISGSNRVAFGVFVVGKS